MFESARGRKLNEGVGRVLFGKWRNHEGTSEELVLTPVSHEELLIHCHGGRAPVQAILETLRSAGFHVEGAADRLESPTDLAGEIQWGLLHAPTRKIAEIFLHLQAGALSDEIGRILSMTRLDQLRDRLVGLRQTWSIGQFLVRPIRVVLAGPPNVGKSSLNNRLLGYSRSIVMDRPGTTRDVVSEGGILDGWSFEFSDTAGIRLSENEIETAGIGLALEKLAMADVEVRVLSGETGLVDAKREMAEVGPEGRLWVLNKMDLLEEQDRQRAASEFPHLIQTDALSGEGIQTLLSGIRRQAIPHEPRPQSPLLFTERQVEYVDQALREIEEAIPDADGLARVQTCLGRLVG